MLAQPTTSFACHVDVLPSLFQMVTCDSESARLGGFRLGAREESERRPRTPSVSSLSLYKQKIDALFALDDARSVASLPQYAPAAHLTDTKVN